MSKLIERLRKASVAIYIATEESVAKDIATLLTDAANALDEKEQAQPTTLDSEAALRALEMLRIHPLRRGSYCGPLDATDDEMVSMCIDAIRALPAVGPQPPPSQHEILHAPKDRPCDTRPDVLTVEQVADLRSRSTFVVPTSRLTEVCDSHEALRAALSAAEQRTVSRAAYDAALYDAQSAHKRAEAAEGREQALKQVVADLRTWLEQIDTEDSKEGTQLPLYANQLLARLPPASTRGQ